MDDMTLLTDSEIDGIESRLGVRLPVLYKTLLREMGYGTFGKKADVKWNTTKEVYHPESITELYRDFFDDPSVLLSRYFPFGCDNESQEIWVINALLEKAATISHETHPDDWDEESWSDNADWVTPTIN